MVMRHTVTRGNAFRMLPLQLLQCISRAEVWASRLAESVGFGAEDAVVVVLDMSTPQGRRRKKAMSVGINDE
jgi:hypothetical protein